MHSIRKRVAKASFTGRQQGRSVEAAAGRLAVLGVAACALAWPAAPARAFESPSAAFVQAGSLEGTHALTTGLTWDWNRHWALGSGQLGGYWELSLSRWSYPSMDGRQEAWLGQVGVVPTWRYRFGEAAEWFVEGGIGASATTTIYETRRKRFSTTFNFADHVGIGRSFGESGTKEISLRFEHFSNAGIKHPNPGANFIQVRLSWSFR